VQIDPDFAIAYQAIARQRANLAYSEPQIDEVATRAFELRGRDRAGAAGHRGVLSPERHRRSRAIHRDQHPVDRHLPERLTPAPCAGGPYNTAAQYEKSVASAREAVRLNPDVAAAYSNLAGSLFALDRLEEAREVYRQAMARGLDAPEYHAFLWRIAYCLGDAEGMQREFDWAAASSSWSFKHAFAARPSSSHYSTDSRQVSSTRSCGGIWRQNSASCRSTSAFDANREP
jgi:tetratricopeptide (TPR) repeat protein